MKLRNGRTIYNLRIIYNYTRIDPINLSFKDREIELNNLLYKCNCTNIILSKEFDYFFYSYEYYLLIYKILFINDNYYSIENKNNILKILTNNKSNEYEYTINLFYKYMNPLINEIINLIKFN